MLISISGKLNFYSFQFVLQQVENGKLWGTIGATKYSISNFKSGHPMLSIHAVQNIYEQTCFT